MTEHWQPLERRDQDPGYVRNPDLEELRAHHDIDATDEIWTNDRYQVGVTYMQPNDPALPYGRQGMVHLSIHWHDRRATRDWRHLQQIKNEVVGPDRQAVEIFPPEKWLVDTSNEYHLWVLPEGVDLPFGFQVGLVSSEDETAAFNEAREQGAHKGVQRPWEPGLTTGRNDETAFIADDETTRQVFERMIKKHGGG